MTIVKRVVLATLIAIGLFYVLRMLLVLTAMISMVCIFGIGETISMLENKAKGKLVMGVITS